MKRVQIWTRTVTIPHDVYMNPVPTITTHFLVDVVKKRILGKVKSLLEAEAIRDKLNLELERKKSA